MDDSSLNNGWQFEMKLPNMKQKYYRIKKKSEEQNYDSVEKKNYLNESTNPLCDMLTIRSQRQIKKKKTNNRLCDAIH